MMYQTLAACNQGRKTLIQQSKVITSGHRLSHSKRKWFDRRRPDLFMVKWTVSASIDMLPTIHLRKYAIFYSLNFNQSFSRRAKTGHTYAPVRCFLVNL